MRLALALALALLGGCDACVPQGSFPDLPDGGPPLDAGPSADAGSVDAGALDAGPSDAGSVDAGTPPVDAGTLPVDAGTPPVDAGTTAIDAGPPAPDAGPFVIRQQVINDSASTGTPDTYFFDTIPGTPFSASIVGGGNGTWSVNVNNGTSQGIYCSGTDTCEITVPAGETTLLVTAITTDIGSYTLTVDFAERP